MFVQGLLVVLLAASTTTKEISKNVGDKWSRVVDCITTFSFCSGPQEYKFTSESEEPIKIFCPVFRSAGCSKANMTFSDGDNEVVKCGEVGPFQIVGKSTEVTAKLGGVGAYVDCSAKTIHEPRSYTDLTLSLDDAAKSIKAPKRFASEQTDNAWRISTSEGNKISVSCFTRLAKKINSECVKDILTINNGEDTKQYCGRGKVEAESTGTELVMRLETYQATEGIISCTAKAVKA